MSKGAGRPGWGGRHLCVLWVVPVGQVAGTFACSVVVHGRPGWGGRHVTCSGWCAAGSAALRSERWVYRPCHSGLLAYVCRK
ncbi:hypothetical protein GCM10010431_45250 [Streptomyces kunmingensis]